MSSKSKKEKKKLATLKKKRRTEFKVFIVCFLVLGCLMLLARLIVFDMVKMDSDAMSPSLQQGDLVFVNKLTLWQEFDIQRGDRVYAVMGDSKLIRTVYGLPGDLVDVREDGTYIVDADGNETKLSFAGNLKHGTIPENTVLLLNENPTSTAPDGRVLGLTGYTEIAGKPGNVIWPLGRAFLK